jgi:hypothetical protein
VPIPLRTLPKRLLLLGATLPDWLSRSNVHRFFENGRVIAILSFTVVADKLDIIPRSD